MQSNEIVQLVQQLRAEDALDDGSLRTLLSWVPDPRRAQGKRYGLPFLLCCLIWATLCHCDSLDAIAQWCAAHQERLRTLFPEQRFHAPSGSLLRRLLPRLSVTHIEACVATWLQRQQSCASEPLACDGKTVRGAGAAAQAAPHLLSFSTHQTHQTLVQSRVEDKTNEIPVARTLLDALPLTGRVVTADALHTQVETAHALLDGGADYLLVVKDNQPTLYAECLAFFTDPTARVRRTQTIEFTRGRRERRTLVTTTQLCSHLARDTRFPAIAQVACVMSETERAGKTQRDVRFLLTSLPPTQASPERLLTLARGHWSIESRHWIRDVTFQEDASLLRTGHAPQILAAVRNLAISLIRRLAVPNIRAQRRAFAFDPSPVFPLIL